MHRVQICFEEKALYPLKEYNIWFAPLGNLFNRLISQYYVGKELKMLDIAFWVDLPPNTESYFYVKYDKVLLCNEIIDLSSIALNDDSNKIIWEKAYSAFKDANTHYNFPGFGEALDKAYAQGLSINLALDYVYKEKEIRFNEDIYKAIIYIKFTENIDELTVLFRVEKDKKIITEEVIMKGQRNEAIFLYAIKNISFDKKGNVVIRGMNNVCKINFPIKIKITDGISLS